MNLMSLCCNFIFIKLMRFFNQGNEDLFALSINCGFVKGYFVKLFLLYLDELLYKQFTLYDDSISINSKLNSS